MPRSRHGPASPSTDEEAYQAWRIRRQHLFRPSSDEPMDPVPSSTTVIAISATAEGQERTIHLPHTLPDTSLTHSLISRSNARASRGRIQTISRPITLIDSHGRRHSSSACVSLRWHFINAMQSFTDTFFVVDDDDCAPYDAMLHQQQITGGRHGSSASGGGGGGGSSERVHTYLYAPPPSSSSSSRNEGRHGNGGGDREKERERERQKEAKKREVDEKIRREIQRRVEKGGGGAGSSGGQGSSRNG